jgi:hypothetical protein
MITGYAAGVQKVVPGALLNENFEVTYGIGKLTILPATLTVKANNVVVPYGTPPVFTSTITGFQYDNTAENFLTGTKQPSYIIKDANGNTITGTDIPAGVYTITPTNLPLVQPTSYNANYISGTLYVNPKGKGARKVKPYLECVEFVPNASGFKYIAHFAYTNDNATTVYVEFGSGDNFITSSGRYSGTLPSEFLPGTHNGFKIYFDGSKLTWTVSSFDINQKTAVASIASSSSTRCSGQNVITGIQAASEDEMQSELIRAGQAKLYPNPASDKVIISSYNVEVNVNEIKVFDIYGRNYGIRKIHRQSNNSLELDISGLAKGTYFIRIKEGHNYKTFPFIKYE